MGDVRAPDGLHGKDWKQTRRRMNASERRLFNLLKPLGFRVIPQVQIGDISVDFLLPNERVIIEADGKPYHSGSEAQRKAARQDHELQERGYMTIHVWTDTLFEDEQNARDHILTRLYLELGIKSPVKSLYRLYRRLEKRKRRIPAP